MKNRVLEIILAVPILLLLIGSVLLFTIGGSSKTVASSISSEEVTEVIASQQNADADENIVSSDKTILVESGVEISDTDEEEESDGDYIFPNSDTVLITDAEASALSKEDAQLAINEIMAREGRTFKDESIQAYFDSKTWYQNTPKIDREEFDAHKDQYLNAVEQANIETLSKYR